MTPAGGRRATGMGPASRRGAAPVWPYRRAREPYNTDPAADVAVWPVRAGLARTRPPIGSERMTMTRTSFRPIAAPVLVAGLLSYVGCSSRTDGPANAPSTRIAEGAGAGAT